MRMVVMVMIFHRRLNWNFSDKALAIYLPVKDLHRRKMQEKILADTDNKRDVSSTIDRVVQLTYKLHWLV